MTWGEIQIESLKKMFLNNDVLNVEKLEEYKKDKKYKTYLFAMPQVVNEAVDYLCTNVSPIISFEKFELNTFQNPLDLKTLPNFKRLHSVIFSSDHPSYRVNGNYYLTISDWDKGNCTIYYESYPDRITEITDSSQTFQLETTLVNLLPLYIAGELYMDDNIQLSTMYKNEFLNLAETYAQKGENNYPRRIETIY